MCRPVPLLLSDVQRHHALKRAKPESSVRPGMGVQDAIRSVWAAAAPAAHATAGEAPSPALAFAQAAPQDTSHAVQGDLHVFQALYHQAAAQAKDGQSEHHAASHDAAQDVGADTHMLKAEVSQSTQIAHCSPRLCRIDSQGH